METINMTNAQALAVVEAHSGYCLSDDQVALVALSQDGNLICVACLRDVQEPVEVVEGVQEQIRQNGNSDCAFFCVSKNADHVLTLQKHGIRCFLGISDDAELSYLSYRPIAKSREEFIADWAFRSTVAPVDVTWGQATYETRQDALQVLLEQVTAAPERSVSLLLSALSGPVWLRDALMTRLASRLAEYETTLKSVAQSTEDPAILAPIAFAVLMGGNELAASALADRITDDTSLMELVRQSLQSGQSHLISKQMITDELLETCIRTGL